MNNTEIHKLKYSYVVRNNVGNWVRWTVTSPLFITIIAKAHHYCLTHRCAIQLTLNHTSFQLILFASSNLSTDTQEMT
jgi:hypothetical protein